MLALARANDLLLQAQWTSADLRNIVRDATEAFDSADMTKLSIEGPAIQITSGAVIAIAMYESSGFVYALDVPLASLTT